MAGIQQLSKHRIVAVSVPLVYHSIHMANERVSTDENQEIMEKMEEEDGLIGIYFY